MNRLKTSRFAASAVIVAFAWLEAVVAPPSHAIAMGESASQSPTARESGTSSPRMLSGASSGEHSWIVVPSDREAGQWHLLHHAKRMTGPHYSPQPISMSRDPEAMAAYGKRVWIIFPPAGEPDGLHRGVFTVAVEYEAAVESYRPSPRDRLQIVEALPAAGRLAGAVATPDGPAVLLVPIGERDRPGPAAEVAENDIDAHSGADAAAWDEILRERPLLLQLRGNRWHEIDLPAGVTLTQHARLAAVGSDRTQLALLSRDSDDGARTVLHRREIDGTWQSSGIDLDFRRVVRIDTVGGRLLAIIEHDEPGRHSMVYVRPTMLLELGELPEPRGRWNVFGVGEEIRLVEFSTRDGPQMRRVNPVTGEAAAPEAMSVQPTPIGRRWYHTMLLLAMVLAILLVLMIRPNRAEKIELPRGLGIVGPMPRFLALVMDLFPAGVLTVLVLRCSPLDLFRLPFFAASPEAAAPFLMMIGLTILHMTLTELLAATTLGKALMGAKVIGIDGNPPGMRQILVRNAVKLLILLIPVLAIFAMLNPNLRGFNDLVARTVVVGSAIPGDEEQMKQDRK